MYTGVSGTKPKCRGEGTHADYARHFVNSDFYPFRQTDKGFKGDIGI